MRITDTDVFITSPGTNYVLVKLTTADGLVGWGDASLGRRSKAVEAALRHHVLPELDGRDAARIEDAWQSLFRHTYWRGGPVLNSALSGVDMALWDLKGKAADMPVYELLGGRTREYASVYQHCSAESPEAVVANCESALSNGFDHLRFRINNVDAESQEVDVPTVVEGMTYVRENLPPEAKLVVDFHGRPNLAEATQLVKAVEPLNLFFVEDPIRPERLEAVERLRSQSTTPLGIGELYVNPWEILPLVENDLVDFVRVDLAHVGGITAAEKIAIVAEHHYVRTAFHGPTGISPIAFAASVHLDLSLPNFGVQELPGYVPDPEDSMYAADYSIPETSLVREIFDGGAGLVDGTDGVDVDDTPGLGVAVDEDVAREYPYEQLSFPAPRNADGSVQDF